MDREAQDQTFIGELMIHLTSAQQWIAFGLIVIVAVAFAWLLDHAIFKPRREEQKQRRAELERLKVEALAREAKRHPSSRRFMSLAMAANANPKLKSAAVDLATQASKQESDK
jgi:peptidoglycan/LPS O-acetylase OafA/YrhL